MCGRVGHRKAFCVGFEHLTKVGKSNQDNIHQRQTHSKRTPRSWKRVSLSLNVKKKLRQFGNF